MSIQLDGMLIRPVRLLLGISFYLASLGQSKVAEMGWTTDKGRVTDARRSLGDTMFSTCHLWMGAFGSSLGDTLLRTWDSHAQRSIWGSASMGHQGEPGENMGGTITSPFCRNLHL